MAVFEQFRGGAERQRQVLLGGVEFLQRGVFLALADDEAAADGEEGGAVQGFAVGVGNGERHAVGVPGQDRERPQHHVFDAVGQGDGAGQLQFPAVGDGGQPLLHFLGEDQFRVVALEAEQDGRHGPVPMAGGGEGPVEVHAQRRHTVQIARGLELLGENGGGPHGADGVRTRRPDPNGKKIKDANSHGRVPNWISVGLERQVCCPRGAGGAGLFESVRLSEGRASTREKSGPPGPGAKPERDRPREAVNLG